ncbi:MAG: hypothetical protein KBE09_04150, partial [Candidatus Pacebacteria bacterium]|nr:hypothetical protein [Candidatus Paceibacterota bacterium]
LHHAYLFTGSTDAHQQALDFLSARGISVSGSADVVYRAYDRLGIDDVLQIVQRSITRPVDLPRRVVVLNFADATTEAQNALLKLLEEPPAPSVFFIVTPSPHTLLPTLRSRLSEVVDASGSGLPREVREFVGASVQARLEIIKELLATKDDDDVRTLMAITTLLHGVEQAIAPGLAQAPMRDGLRSLYAAKRALTTPGAALKPLLEQLAILLPRVGA